MKALHIFSQSFSKIVARRELERLPLKKPLPVVVVLLVETAVVAVVLVLLVEAAVAVVVVLLVATSAVVLGKQWVTLGSRCSLKLISTSRCFNFTFLY